MDMDMDNGHGHRSAVWVALIDFCYLHGISMGIGQEHLLGLLWVVSGMER
jgi:hypothetical protein